MSKHYVVTTFAFAAIAVLTACVPQDVTTPTNPLDCQRGFYEDPASHTCVLRPDVVTIVVSGSRDCSSWLKSPNPASVRTGQSFRFQNTTAFPFTVMIRNMKLDNSAYPLTTVAAGQSSSAFSYNVAGTWTYTETACNGGGTLIVTVG